MSYKVGKSKPMTEVTFKECLRYPIWEWALDEETLPGHDETWQRPITSTKDVTPDMVDPTITFRVAGSDLVGTAIYDDHTCSLSSISFWDDGEWVDVRAFDNLQPPLELVAVPTIGGSPGVRFLLSDPNADCASQMAEGQTLAPPSAPGSMSHLRRTPLAFLPGGTCNGAHMVGGCEAIMSGVVGLAFCPGCGFRTDFEYTNSNFRLRTRKYDFSETYEGCWIVSERFKAYCELSGYPGLRFVSLPKSRGFYHFLVDRTLPLDAERIGIKTQRHCAACGNHGEIFGLFTHYIRDLKCPLEDGILGSDMLVGSGNWKHRILYVGPMTRQRMKAAKLKGLHFGRYP